MARTLFGTPTPRLLAVLFSLVSLAWRPSPADALPYTVTGRTDYPVGAGPEWSTVADLNNDGHNDIVTANYGGSNVTVLLNNGSGGYLPGTDYAAGAGPFTVAAFDLNNDQFQDLVVANYAAGTISVLMGNGTGAFPTHTDHASGSGTAVAALGWFNGDGYADFVTANYGANTVSVFTGDGAGGFTSKTDFTVGLNPNWVAVADLNGDGSSDLVTANAGGNSITVLYGNGLGSFGSRIDYPVGNAPLTLVLDYLNGDGAIDVATANWASNTLSVRLGDGSGGFGPAVTFPTATGPVTVDSGDLNLDGNVDLAVCNDGSASVSVLFGTGTGSFAPKTDFTVGPSPYAVSIGDVTGDGEADLVSCNFGSNSVSILKGNWPGGFAVGDTLVDLTAFDQGGVSRSLSGYAGKWMLVDASAVWCGPCNAIAKETRQVCDTWATAGTLPFEYVTSLYDGPVPNQPSTQTIASKWATNYQLNSPVLHANGFRRAANRSWFLAVGTNAFPTLLFVDAQRKIREISLGALDGQTIVNKFAALAGVAAPTLAAPLPPPPPPPPPDAPRAAWQTLQGATIEITHGLSTWTGTLGAPDTPNWTSATFESFPAGVPGIPNSAWIKAVSATDSTTGTESIDLFVGTADVFDSIDLSESWQVKLKNIVWPDAQPRVLVTGNTLVLSAIYPQPGSGADTYFQTPIQPIVNLSGIDATLTAFQLGNVPDIPSSTNAFAVTTLRLKHQFQVADVPRHSGALVTLSPPRPNPARRGAELRWAMSLAGEAQLRVVDVAGRVVRRLHSGIATAGEHTTAWDLRRDDGTQVAPGLYFVRFESLGQPEQSTRLVVIR